MVMEEEVATPHQDVTMTMAQRFTVLRNRKSLRLLSGWCKPTTSKGQRACRLRVPPPPLDLLSVKSFLTSHGMTLVWVRLSLLSGGKPELHGMVCAPTSEDLKQLKAPGGVGPREPPHKDHFKSRIKSKKSSKKAAAPALPSDKTVEKELELSSAADPNPPSSSSPLDLVLGLWPDPLPSIAPHCSRLTLGWVTQGDFSLSAGCGEALGFVSVSGLLNTLQKQPTEHRGTVLLRNPNSLQYRFAKINIEV